MAPPLAAFIARFNLNRKTVVPFHTHGGGVGIFRELATIGALANMAGTEGQLRFHFGAALNTGK